MDLLACRFCTLLTRRRPSTSWASLWISHSIILLNDNEWRGGNSITIWKLHVIILIKKNILCQMLRGTLTWVNNETLTPPYDSSIPWIIKIFRKCKAHQKARGDWNPVPDKGIDFRGRSQASLPARSNVSYMYIPHLCSIWLTIPSAHGTIVP